MSFFVLKFGEEMTHVHHRQIHFQSFPLVHLLFFLLPMHCRKIPDGRYVDVRKPSTFSSFRPQEETVFIVHGFNGTARDKHMRYLKDGNLITIVFIFISFYVIYSLKLCMR